MCAKTTAIGVVLIADLLIVFGVVARATVEERAYQGPSVRLTRFLQKHHVSAAPPDGTVIVHHEMELVNILSLDELKQTMRVLVYIEQEWDDPSLSWNPANFSGILHTWLPMDSVWIPDIIVFNMLDHSELLHAVRTPVKIEHTGRVTFSYPAIYTVMCILNIGLFPFDDQRCTLRVASWGYDNEKLVLNASNNVVLEHYLCNEEWALTGIAISNEFYTHEGLVVSEVQYTISVCRKPLFYIITLVLPSYIICTLSVAGLFARFSTRNEREERFTLGVTAILTMAVLSLVVAEKVPHSSEEVPIMVMYFHFNIIVVTMATVCTSTVMRVHWRGLRKPAPPPDWLLSMLCIKKMKGRTDNESPDELELLTRLAQDELLQRHSASNRVSIYAEQWGAVSRRCDYILAIAFLGTISLPTAFMFLKNHQRLHDDVNGPIMRSCIM